MDTRRYAKRQVTWFRNQLAGWQRIPVATAADEIVRALNG
jgi:tRNA dimethylallyltransferase